jgi:hypothetical protein
MPVSVRKSIKIAPGTRLNLSQRGVSASIGAGGVRARTGQGGCLKLVAAPFVLIFQLYVLLFKGLWWVLKSIWGLFKNPTTRMPAIIVSGALVFVSFFCAGVSVVADSLGLFTTPTATVDIAALQTQAVQTVMANVTATFLASSPTINLVSATPPATLANPSLPFTLTNTLFPTATDTCTPTTAPTQRIIPTLMNTTIPLLPTNPPAPSCCKHCGGNSQPCGDSCISNKYTCHKAPGCACP